MVGLSEEGAAGGGGAGIRGVVGGGGGDPRAHDGSLVGQGVEFRHHARFAARGLGDPVEEFAFEFGELRER